MKNLFKNIITVVALGFVSTAFSQGDVCANADVIGSIPYNSGMGGSTCGAGDDYSSADLCGSSYMNGDDYVYEYTPSADECIKITLTNTDTWVGVFVTEGCPDAGGTCVGSGTNSSGNPSATANLTAGVTYYIIISTFPSPQCTPYDMDIAACPPPPANDECSGAISLTVNSDYACGTVTSGTVEDATPSTDPASETCSGTADDDVWYSFVATGTAHRVELTNIAGSTTDMYHSVYAEGMGCPSLGAEITCNDGNTSNLTGLTPGATYYVRVYTYTSSSGQNSTFDVCVGTPPPPPTNDECTTPIALTVNSANSCTSTTSATAASATDSGEPGCTGTADDDVWFSFVAPSSGTIEVTLSNITGTTDLVHEVFAIGAMGCSSVTSLGCSDPNNSITSGLTGGETYLVRVYTYSSTGSNTGFDICVAAGPTAGVTCYSQSNPSWPGIVNGAFALSPGDDEFETTGRNITFPFCWMGAIYEVMYVSSNGYISFDPANQGAYSQWTTDPIPDPASDILASIMAPWHDIDPGAGTGYTNEIQKRNIGVAPNRSVEITFNDIALFSSSCHDPGPGQTSQIKLYETSNIVDIRIEEKSVCTSWNNGDATMGFNGPLGLNAVVVSGRNDQNWSASNEVTRFIPTCDVCPVTLEGKEFSYFDARNFGRENEIMWGTAYEDNVTHFEVQRSADAINYETIAKVNSTFGSTESETPYVYMDKKPLQGKNYYRVKRMNQDGEWNFTRFKSVDVSLKDKPRVYPNPATDRLFFEFESLDSDNINVIITDVSGKEVLVSEKDVTSGFNKLNVDISNMVKGVYFYNININHHIERGKITIK